MKSIIAPRRYGKTTELLKLAKQEPVAIFVSGTISTSDSSFRLCREFFKDEIDTINMKKKIITFDNGNVLLFKNYSEALEAEFEKIPKYMDEINYILNHMFGDVKGFNGTTENIDISSIPPKHLGSIRTRYQEMSTYMTDEEFYREMLCLPFNQEKK